MPLCDTHRVRAIAARLAAGVRSDDRVLAVKQWPQVAHVGAKTLLCDLVLDSHIYAGHSTVAETLWASLPVTAVVQQPRV